MWPCARERAHQAKTANALGSPLTMLIGATSCQPQYGLPRTIGRAGNRSRQAISEELGFKRNGQALMLAHLRLRMTLLCQVGCLEERPR
jgi:hypothetical protein